MGYKQILNNLEMKQTSNDDIELFDILMIIEYQMNHRNILIHYFQNNAYLSCLRLINIRFELHQCSRLGWQIMQEHEKIDSHSLYT